MRTLLAWLLRVGALFHKEQSDRELADEIESNLQLHIYDNIRAGMTQENARRQALLKFGGIGNAHFQPGYGVILNTFPLRDAGQVTSYSWREFSA